MAAAAGSGGGGGGSPPVNGMLKSKFQIGSKRGRLNYSAEEKVFHPSDVPLKAKEARIHVHNSLHPDRRAGNGPLPWDYGTVAGPAKSGTKTMPWDDMEGWDDRHYAGIDTAALVAKAQERMARIRSGKMSVDDDHPSNINPRWRMSGASEPPKLQLLSHIKRPPPKPLNEKDIKRLVKTAVPIPIGGGGGGTAADGSDEKTAAAGPRTGTGTAGRRRSSESASNATRPSLRDRVSADLNASRATKQLARLTAAHSDAFEELTALHTNPKHAVKPSATAATAEQLNDKLRKLQLQLAEAANAAVATAAGSVVSKVPAAAAIAAAAEAKRTIDAANRAAATKLLAATTLTATATVAGSASGAGAGATGGVSRRSTLSGAGSAISGSSKATKSAKPVRRVMEHTGSFGRPNVAMDECWSCCLAEKRNSPGCTATHVSVVGGWNWAQPTGL